MLNYIANKQSEEFYTEERCHIVELLNDDTSPQLSMARCRVLPGIITQLHALNQTEETYFIENGSGVMDDGEGNLIEVGVGDSVRIDKNHPQRIRNTGENDLIFLVVCQPRFLPECYLNLEDGGS
jgi:mannose-6-phosphate isomerase-like protein (cupin superfamily)